MLIHLRLVATLVVPIFRIAGRRQRRSISTPTGWEATPLVSLRFYDERDLHVLAKAYVLSLNARNHIHAVHTPTYNYSHILYTLCSVYYIRHIHTVLTYKTWLTAGFLLLSL